MKKKGASSHFRKAAFFLAAAMILQALFTLLLTPQGLVTLYPYAVRSKSEKVENDASFAEYYPLRREFADCTLFFLGADTTVADSYSVILDYLRFLKRNFEITTLTLSVGTTTADRINTCLAASDTTELLASLEELKSNGRFTLEFINFVKDLCTLNQTLTPERKITVRSMFTESIYSATISRMSSHILSNWGNAGGEVSGIMSVSDVDAFFAYMTEYSAAFTEYLGEEEYNRYMELKAHYEAGDYDEWAIASKLPELADEHTLVIVSQNAVRQKSPLRAFVSELGKNASYMEVKYADSRGLRGGEEIEMQDIDLPFASQRSVRFVSRDDLEGFRSYYRLIANPFAREDRREVEEYLDTLATPNFFVVIGSRAVSYDENTEAAQ